ncbi:MAG: STAS domain-containing protein [Oculatellaceae cyanobacterium Prado106]|jgi:rsbT co-antagonist protein RsbR|nr:STAS domain-containing protein [Oculatellaceae cyanobacterium Prado106]
MVLKSKSVVAKILEQDETTLQTDWLKALENSDMYRKGVIRPAELRDQCSEFLRLLRNAMQQGNLTEIQAPEWANTRQFLADMTRVRAQQGFSPQETTTFVFSLKKPLFDRLWQELPKDPQQLAEEVWNATTLLDQLGLWTIEVFQKNREEIILRQQQDLLELSTPVVKLWDSILALPMIGTLDSSRTQVVMESLLQQILETESQVVIIDITGVPTVDTLVAQHLLKTVAAARLMGTDCIISGIRPQIAQTIVHLGVDLSEVTTKASLADAFAIALKRQGLKIVAAS